MNHNKLLSKIKTASAFSLLVIAIISFSCCSSKQTQNKEKTSINKNKALEKVFSINSPANYEQIKQGQIVNIKLQSKKKVLPDSIVAELNGKEIELSQIDNELSYLCNINNEAFGRTQIRLDIYHSDSLKENHIITVLHLPKSEPKKLTYKVIRRFKHDKEAYTQGLIYKDGVLYESTGQQRRSSIRAVDPETGEIQRKKALEPQYFGEGIAIVGKEIFMLTYKAQRGFVFDLATFNLTRKFNLQTMEGWGLTSLNDTIIMSDGTANLYFCSPDEYFTQLGQKEICNNLGLVNNLNELEYTPDGLYSNVYGQNIIYLIDIHKGIVTHSLDLSALFPKDVPRNMDYVLNGIAYNKKSDTFYVTGKQWPVMYEIQISAN